MDTKPVDLTPYGFPGATVAARTMGDVWREMRRRYHLLTDFDQNAYDQKTQAALDKLAAELRGGHGR
jgi:hypothetical protein